MKLTLVSITFHGKTYSLFVNAKMVDGKAIIDQNLIDVMLAFAGCERGQTYTMG